MVLRDLFHNAKLLRRGNSPRKLSRWLNRCQIELRGRQRVLDFELEYLNTDALRLLYEEIFVREEYLFSSKSEAPVIFDCGANIGLATMYFKWRYPHSRITAFEPDPLTFQTLGRNVQRNHLPDVSIHNVALWKEDGALSFFVPENAPGSPKMSAYRPQGFGREITVSSKRLSDYITGPVDLVKMDIEGAEHEVMCDLVRSGKIEQVREMIIEYHHNIPGDSKSFGGFLSMLESCGLRSQINSLLQPIAR